MPYPNTQPSRAAVHALADEQHGRVSRAQLLDLGLHPQAIKRRIGAGYLTPVRPGVYAVGARGKTRHGEWMAAVLQCGPTAVLSHTSAAALWGLLRRHLGVIEISVLSPADPHADGVRVHRRRRLDGVLHEYIPVTRPADTIVDMAPRLSVDALEGMISLADVLGLTTPAQLRRAADGDQRPGTGIVKRILDPYLFRLTRSKLERLFLRLCDEAGLARPLTRQWVNGYEVDFHWPDLGWVVETDGGTFHRTPMQQTEDRRRDQAHARAGLHCVRFTHWQVAYEREYVAETLAMCLAGATR